MPDASTAEAHRFDLVVIGGGLAGICAAIAAARLGLKVALVNDRPVLGGNSSSEIRVPIGGADVDFRWARETGIIEELRIEDRFRNPFPVVSGQTTSTWDMILWEWVRREENIELFLNTSARQAIMDGPSRISAVLCEQLGTEKSLTLKADFFVDASGDGQIAASAGAPFRIGREARSEFGEELAPEEADTNTLGSSIMFKATDLGRPVEFIRPAWAEEYPTDDDLPYRWHGRIESGYWWIELGGDRDTIRDNEQIKEELWRCLFGVWDHIKNRGDHGADNLALEWVGSIPGKRESRRFLGDYILTENDVESECRFYDSVAYGGWPIDLHPPRGIRHPGPPCEFRHLPGLYAIPFRCLYSRKVENLFFAGRNISVTHVALGTTRLMATCAVMGQAVGTAAYLCKKHGSTPRLLGQTKIRELQQLLLKNDCYIPGVRNEDPDDLARAGSASASSEMELEVTHLDRYVALDRTIGQIFPFAGSKLDQIQLFLRCSSRTPRRVTLHLRRAKSWTDTSSKEDVATASEPVPFGSSWIRFPLHLEGEAGFYWIVLDPAEDVFWGLSREEPIGVQRTGEEKWVGGSYLFKTTPPSRPYAASNVLNGVSRPDGWTNIWVSDPRRGLPQSLEVRLPKPVKIGEVRITFDTDLDDLPRIGAPATCVKSYEVRARVAGRWETVASAAHNHHRLAVHKFQPLVTDTLRIEVKETWGSPSARIYEVRAYGPKV